MGVDSSLRERIGVEHSFWHVSKRMGPEAGERGNEKEDNSC